MKILQPARWPRPKGYANGVFASGRTVFVSGMIGSDAEGAVVAGDFVAQARQALKNIVEVLAEAGAKPEHIARMNWYVVDKKEYLGVQSGARCGLSRNYRPSLPRNDGSSSRQPHRRRRPP